MSNNIPDPILRKEKYLAKIAENTAGGGAEPTVLMANKNITANGVVNPDSGFDGFAKVTINVPNTYTAGDEGKVVDNGALVAQTSTTVTQNDTYTTTTNNQVIVNVPNTYTVSDEGKVVDNGALVSQTSANINTNGTHTTTTNNEVVVAVPNTYAAGDEGKVVSSGELVAQTAYPSTVTVNDTYDTTNYNSITVDVPTGGTPTSGAFYMPVATGNSLCIAIVGTKGGSGYICGAYKGIVNTYPFDSFTLTDFNLSDYLSTSHGVTFVGRYSSSTIYYFTITLNPFDNTITFSNISGQSSPTNSGTKSTAFSNVNVL